MKTIGIAVSSIGTLLMLYTMVCGLWIHSHGATAEEISYHSRNAVTSVVLVLAEIGLLVYQLLKE